MLFFSAVVIIAVIEFESFFVLNLVLNLELLCFYLDCSKSKTKFLTKFVETKEHLVVYQNLID